VARKYDAGSIEVEVALNDEKFQRDLKQTEKDAKNSAEQARQDYEKEWKKRSVAGRAVHAAMWAGIITVSFLAIRKIAQRYGWSMRRAADSAAVSMGRRWGSGLIAAMTPAFRRAGASAKRGWARILVPLEPVLNRMGRLWDRSAAKMRHWRSRGADVASDAMHRLGLAIRGNGHGFRALMHQMSKMGGVMSRMGTSIAFISALWVQLKLNLWLTAAAIAGLGTLIRTNIEYTFARVKTLLKGYGPEVFGPLQDAIRELSTTTGIASDKINNTLYQTLSAMPQLAKDTAAAMEIVTVATKVAATGFAEAEEAVKAITGILNAYKLEAREAINVADALFAAQDQGVTTFGEMAQEIGRVTGLASAMGGDWKDLLAIIATNTPFINTSETITQIESVLAGVLERSPQVRKEAKRLELEFDTVALKAKGLIPFLQEIVEVTGGDPETIAKLFGRREATQLIVTLAQNMETLAEKQRIVAGTTGTLEQNLSIMTQTLKQHLKLAKEEWKAVLEEIGEDYDSTAKGMVIATKRVAKAINDGRKLVKEHGYKLGRDYEGKRDPITGKWDGPPPWDVSLYGKGTFPSKMEDPDFSTVAPALRKFAKKVWDTLRREMLYGGQAFDEWADVIWEPIRHTIDDLMAEPIAVTLTPLDLMQETFVRPDRPKPTAPIAPPPAIKFDEQVEAINKYRAALEGKATIDFTHHRDMERYARDMESATRSVNERVIAEYNLVRAQGASHEAATQILGAFRAMENTAQQAQRERHKAAAAARMELAPTGIMQALGLDPNAPGTTTVQPFIQELIGIDARVQQLADRMRTLSGTQKEYHDVLAEINRLEDYRHVVIDLIRSEVDLAEASKALKTNITAMLRDVTPAQREALGKVIEGVADASTAVVDAQNKLIAATASQDTERIKAAKAGLIAVQNTLKAVIRDAIAIMAEAGLDPQKLRELLDLMAETERRGGGDGEAKSFWERLPEIASSVEGVARGVLSVARAMDILDESTERVLRGIIDIAAGVGRIAAGDLIGGIPQAAGGLIGFASGLFGEDAEDKARRKIMEQNTLALKRLTEALDEQRRIVLGSAGEDIAELGRLFDPAAAAAAIGLPDPKAHEFARFWAKELGYGTDELDKAVKEVEAMLAEVGLNFRLLTDSGYLIPDAIEAAREAVGLLTMEDVFGTTFAGEMDRMKRIWDLSDLEDPQVKLQETFKLLEDFLPDILEGAEDILPDFDLSTAEGRAAFEEWAQKLVENFGDLTFAELGPLSPQELLDVISQIEGLVDDVAAEEASKSFQAFTGVTEITANRLVGLLSTDVEWNRQTALNTLAILNELRGELGPAPQQVQVVGKYDEPVSDPRSIDPGLWNQGTVNLSVSVSGAGSVVEIAEELDRVLASRYRVRRLDQGEIYKRT
jgi:TP901 family phage tail tape measure protein